MDRPSCPFCPFSHANPYILAQHVEANHPEDYPEDEIMYLPRAFLDYEEPEHQGNKSDAPSGYVECHCREIIALGELDEHLQLHSAEMENTDMAVDTAERPSPVGFPAIVPQRSKHRSLHKDTKHHNGVKDWVALLLGPGPSSSSSSSSRSKTKHKDPKNVKRLGKAELGPYAHEDQMPLWLLKQLDAGAQVSFVNQINDDGKLISYIQASQSQGFEFFPGRVPSVLDLQELIESAWDRGINIAGRVETGGIRGTRKYIGTPETLFISLSIGCEARALNDAADPPVFKQVYHEVERYFLEHATSSTEKVCKTSAPPIYFQHQGHSLTIIGMEIRSSGSRNLLVFDPSFKPSPGIQRSIGNKIRTSAPEKLLKAYRRGDHYLSKHSTFELLKLVLLAPRLRFSADPGLDRLTSIPHAHDGWDEL
ncbi:MAG: hypothetical protein Q9228_002520 [Teloschistes exilis]